MTFGIKVAVCAAITGFAACSASSTSPSAELAEVDYSDPDNWLCRPDNLRFCDTNLDATVVEAGGTMTVERWTGHAADPSIDCFYLYPTASQDNSSNSDLIPGDQPGEEIHDARRNFARFGEVCRLFAPIYRSNTVTQMIGAAPPGDRDLAYADTLAAWRHYLTHDNMGRGVVLIGHSQGSAHIKRLLQEEIDGEPEQDLLVSALPIGYDFVVPEGADVGGDLNHIPLCREFGQTGCLLTYNTFRASHPPTEESPLGGRVADGRVACVNPAAPGGGSAMLQAYLEARFTMGSDGPPPMAPWVEGAEEVTTPFVRVPSLLEAECVSDDNGDYLALTIHAEPDDPRADNIAGEILRGGNVQYDWGFHLIDMELAMGNLVEVVRLQAENWPQL